MKRRPLILASASPQRRALLRGLRIPFRIVPSRASEASREKDPRKLVVQLALRKALDVARARPRCLVLGADTIVYCRGKVIVKPKSRADSERMIRALSGTWHSVYTGVALALDGGRRACSGCAVSRVKARPLSEEEVLSLAGKHMDKAGGYAVQDRSDPFIKRVSGDRDNVIGLPMRLVRKLLRRMRRTRFAAARRAGRHRPSDFDIRTRPRRGASPSRRRSWTRRRPRP